MTGLIASAMLLLLSHDPHGYRMYEPFQSLMTIVSPIIVNNNRFDCYAWWTTTSKAVACDPFTIQKNISDKKQAPIWMACLLVHESVHMRNLDSTEEYPLTRQYVCLDRLGAPQWMKDWVYQRLPWNGYREDDE